MNYLKSDSFDIRTWTKDKQQMTEANQEPFLLIVPSRKKVADQE